MIQGVEFKFRYVRDGDNQGLMARKGSAGMEGLTLGEDRLPYAHIIDTTTRDKRLLLVVSPQAPLTGDAAKYLNGQVLVLEVYKVQALELEKIVDRACSIQEATRNKERLLEEGKGELFRTVMCPECKAVVDVSELSETPYVYCRYCESVLRDRATATSGADYRICDECGFFNRVKGYTQFYFYFLLVVYGFSYKRRHLCDNCVGPIFWKTLLMNLIFILGVPSAIYMKIKSMVGRDPTLKELNKAARLSRRAVTKRRRPTTNAYTKAVPTIRGCTSTRGSVTCRAATAKVPAAPSIDCCRVAQTTYRRSSSSTPSKVTARRSRSWGA